MKGYKIGIEKNSCHSFSSEMNINQGNHCRLVEMRRLHRIKISNRRATQRCNVSSFFYAKICSLLARRQSSQPVQRVYWPENVIDWLGKWRPTCVMRHARGQKLQSFRRKWPFCMDLYSMTFVSYARNDSTGQSAPTRVSLTSSRLQELLIGQLLRNIRACK
jgi:hypothetical protein